MWDYRVTIQREIEERARINGEVRLRIHSHAGKFIDIY